MAYRLTKAAMDKKARAETSDEDPFSDFSSEQLLEKVPITLHCSPWAECLLLQSQPAFQNFETLDTDSLSAALEKNVSMLVESRTWIFDRCIEYPIRYSIHGVGSGGGVVSWLDGRVVW